jgi:hypothetical protein
MKQFWRNQFLFSAFCLFWISAVQAETSIDLIASFGQAYSASIDKGDGLAKRKARASLNPEALNLLGVGKRVSSLRVSLFPNVVFELQGVKSDIRLVGTAVNEFSITGDKNGSAVLSVTGGVLYGTVTTGTNVVYRIRQEATDIYMIEELDQSKFPECANPPGLWELSELERPAKSSAIAPSSDAVTTEDDGTLIKVLVAYTQAAETAAGGASSMASLIATAEAETNTGYSASGVNFLISVVNTEKVTYDETAGFETALYAITNASDGLMDSVHGLRDTYSADLVVLLIENRDYCGIAWKPSTVSSSNAGFGFSVVGWNCATGYYSFAHEMGHNMGANHDTYVDSSTLPYAYGHGFVNTSARVRSIMAYNTECSDSGFNCTRVNHWSATDSLYNGSMIIGDALATNNVALNNSAYSISNYRSSTPASLPDPPTLVDASDGIFSDKIAVSWSVVADATNYNVYISDTLESTQFYLGQTTDTGGDIGGTPPDAIRYIWIYSENANGESATGTYDTGYRAASVPDAPTLTSATPGDGEATMHFTANGDGGSVITGYTATCGSFSQAGASSPITATGLTNSTEYSCSVIATNVVGDSASSNVLFVTPLSPSTFSIGGTVSGLAGSGLVLQNNGSDDLVIGADGSFTFGTELTNDSGYATTVKTQPTSPNQFCGVTSGSGVVSGADITNVDVTCTLAAPCNVNTVSGVVETSFASHEACEILAVGPSFIAEDGASVFLSSGWEIWFMPGFSVEPGATLNASVCGQSLCATSPYPMPLGCHSCVDLICADTPSCCSEAFDAECLAKVNTVCSLVCE